MKIYTKTGDKGETSLVDGTRVPKNHPRVDAYGTVDELNAVLGLCVSLASQDSVKFDVKTLYAIQNNLFNLGSHLACESLERKKKLPHIQENDIHALEQAIDSMSAELPPLREFILPGGHFLACQLHLARTVCRRAERKVYSLDAFESLSIQYLNRLSDYFFVLARFVNFKMGSPEIAWKKT